MPTSSRCVIKLSADIVAANDIVLAADIGAIHDIDPVADIDTASVIDLRRQHRQAVYNSVSIF